VGRTLVLRVAGGVARLGSPQARRELLQFRRQRLDFPLLPENHIAQLAVGALQERDLGLNLFQGFFHSVSPYDDRFVTAKVTADDRVMKQLLLLVAIVTTLSGCVVMVPGRLYPIQGPLAGQTPAPIYKVTISGVFKSGSMSATLPDGEVCSGSWAAVGQNDPAPNKMLADWDQVFGQGYFVANVLGAPVRARAVLSGPKGTTLDVEFYDPHPGHIESVVGVARDNTGDLFKLTF